MSREAQAHDGPRRSAEYSVLPVTDQQRRLLGIMSLSDIVTSTQGTRVKDVMLPDSYSVTAHQGREEAGRLIQDAHLLGLPVVDSEDRVGLLLGVMLAAVGFPIASVPRHRHRADHRPDVGGGLLLIIALTLVESCR